MAHNAVVLDPTRCNACNLCVRTCPEFVYEALNEKQPPAIAHAERCIGCYACEEDCAHGAIRIYRLPKGMTAEEAPAPAAGLDLDRLYDIAIVGAGPAGLAAAIRARLLGLSVAVIDKLPSPRRSHHPDGGVVQGADLYTLEHRGDHVRIAELDVTIPSLGCADHFVFMGPGAVSSATSARPKKPMPVIDKDALVEALAQRALELGAVIAYNTRAGSIAWNDAERRSEVTLDGDATLRARIAISAEGITGRLAARAGAPVNDRPVGWGYVVLITQPPLDHSRTEMGFMVGPLDELRESTPFLSFWGATPAFTGWATGPMQRHKQRVLLRPLHEYLDYVLDGDQRMTARFGLVDAARRPTLYRDGSRVFARRLPKSAVADGLIAVGDAIATCGMMLNLPAMKTGEIAVEVAAEALAKGDVRAESLAGFDRRVFKLEQVKGMAWMHGLLIEAPLRLGAEDMAKLFSVIRHLNMDELNAGGVRAAWSMAKFFARAMPALWRQPQPRPYIQGTIGD